MSTDESFDTVVNRSAWRRWRRHTWPVALVVAVVASVAMSGAQVQGMVVFMVLLSCGGAALVMTTSDTFPVVAFVTWLVWLYAGVGLFVWSPPIGALVALAVLASTPSVRRVVTGQRQGEDVPVPDVHDLPALTDREVLIQWSRTGHALEMSTARPEHAARIVSRRADLLDEIERRGLARHCGWAA